MKYSTLILLLVSFTLSAEREYTEEEKQAFMKIWNTGRSIVNIAVDDTLNPAVKTILDNQPPPQLKDNAYIYVMGMVQQQDPYEAGLAIYQELLDYADAAYKNPDPLHKHGQVPRPTLALPCAGYFHLCYAQVQKDKKLQANIKKHMAYVQAYEDILKMKYYREEPKLRFSNMFRQLNLLYFLQSFYHNYLLNQAPHEATGWLEKQVLNEHASLRKLMFSADSLIGQLNLSSMYNKNLNLIAYLMQIDKLEQPKVDQALQIFSTAELSLDRVIKADMSNNYKQLLDFHQDLLKRDLSQGVFTMLTRKAIISTLSKPVITINNDYQYRMQPLLEMSHQGALYMMNNLPQLDNAVPEDGFRNLGGTALQMFFSSAPKSYLKLKFSLSNLTMKIQLIKALIAEGSAEQIIIKAQQAKPEYQNIYDQSPPFMDDGSLCQNSIQKPQSNSSCIYIVD